MQSFMKTILSALQAWVNKRIKSNTPNWNESNPEADGYIKNRPFYDEIADKTVVSNVTLQTYDDEPVYNPFLLNEIIAGQVYTIIWDGVEYECEAYIAQGPNTPSLGNGTLGNSSGGNGEPFFITLYYGDVMVFGADGEHTISISTSAEITKKLDTKYLPDEVLAQSDYSQNNENNISYIRNRTHYYDVGNAVTIEVPSTTLSYGSNYISPSLSLPAFNYGFVYHITGTLKAIYSGVEYSTAFSTDCDCYSDGYIYTYVDLPIPPLNVNVSLNRIYGSNYSGSSGNRIRFSFNSESEVTMEATIEISRGVKKLDDAFLSSNIVRTEQLPIIDATLSIKGAAADAKAVDNAIATLDTSVDARISGPKNYISLIDEVSGYTYLVSMCDGTLVSTIGAKSIEVTTMPNKTDYMHSAYFDPEGMVISAICHDGTIKEITNYTYQSDYLVEGATSIDIIYVEAGVTHTATIPITVSAFDPAVAIIDFTYTDNGNGTYTITGWKKTYNGQASTEMIIPNYGCIIV